MLLLGIGAMLLAGALIALANHTAPTRSVAQMLHDLEHPDASGS